MLCNYYVMIENSYIENVKSYVIIKKIVLKLWIKLKFKIKLKLKLKLKF